jgi:cupin-like protein
MDHTSKGETERRLRLVDIPRASCANPHDFLNRFVRERRPVILTDLVTQWPAFGRWTPEHFKDRFPTARCNVVVNLPVQGVPYERKADSHLREMSIPEFVDHMRSTTAPCYYRRQHANKLPGLDADVDFEQLTPGFRADTDFVWIGSAGTRTGLHFDAQDNVLCQIYGTKVLWLVDPAQSKLVRPYSDSVTKSRVAPDQPDFDSFPELERVTFLHGSITAGEAIFIPNRWWHSVVSTSVSISVNHEFGEKTSWSGLASAVNAGGLRSWFSVGRDFVKYGLLKRSFQRRLADDPPFGRVVFDMLAGSLRRRLTRHAGSVG